MFSGCLLWLGKYMCEVCKYATNAVFPTLSPHFMGKGYLKVYCCLLLEYHFHLAPA